MSRSRKKQEPGQYRAIRGNKRARIYNLRSVPPNQWEDIRPDDQCFMVLNIIKNLYNAGVELEQIEKKIRSEYKIKNWEWKEIIGRNFDTTVDVHFMDEFVALGDNDQIIPVSTPGAEPHLMVKIDYLPINDMLIIRESDVLRYQKKRIKSIDLLKDKVVKVDEVYPWPNQKWTEILLFLRDHYIENGMIYWYTIKKWMMGFEKCRIEFLEYEE